MKDTKEIYEKIDELAERADKARRLAKYAEEEAIRCNIDALLWVVGDASGKEI